MHNQTRQNATNTAREGRSAGMRLALNSSLFVAMALMSSVVVAFAQEAPKRADSTSLAQRTNFFSLICAQRDVQLVTLLEERGDAQEVAGHKLFAAFLAMMRARTACIEGRESEALSIYDTVTLDLTLARAAR
jgi:hypothetical protein